MRIRRNGGVAGKHYLCISLTGGGVQRKYRSNPKLKENFN